MINLANSFIIPKDIINRVLIYIEPSDIITLIKTCKHYYKYINEISFRYVCVEKYEEFLKPDKYSWKEFLYKTHMCHKCFQLFKIHQNEDESCAYHPGKKICNTPGTRIYYPYCCYFSCCNQSGESFKWIERGCKKTKHSITELRCKRCFFFFDPTPFLGCATECLHHPEKWGGRGYNSKWICCNNSDYSSKGCKKLPTHDFERFSQTQIEEFWNQYQTLLKNREQGPTYVKDYNGSFIESTIPADNPDQNIISPLKTLKPEPMAREPRNLHDLYFKQRYRRWFEERRKQLKEREDKLKE